MALSLRDLPARRDRNGVDDCVAVDEPDNIDQIRHDTGVIRNHAHAIARLQRGAAGHAHRRVLLRKPLDRQCLVHRARGRAGLRENRAVPRHAGDAAGLIVCQRLAAAVQNDPVNRRLRHDSGKHGERAIVERGRAQRDLRSIEIDVVPGAQLGEPGLADAEAECRRGTDGQFLEREARCGRSIAKAGSVSASWRAIVERSSSDAAR